MVLALALMHFKLFLNNENNVLKCFYTIRLVNMGGPQKGVYPGKTNIIQLMARLKFMKCHWVLKNKHCSINPVKNIRRPHLIQLNIY